MTKAQEKALEAYPVVFRSNYADNINGLEQYLEDDNRNNLCRKVFEEGYEQAEKDLDIQSVKREWWNNGYIEGRKNAHIPARELGLPKSMDFQSVSNELTWEDIDRILDLFYLEQDKHANWNITMEEETCKEVLRKFLESKK